MTQIEQYLTLDIRPESESFLKLFAKDEVFKKVIFV
jgi:hypothetical protein